MTDPKNIAVKVGEKFGRPADMPIDKFFETNMAAREVLNRVLAKANSAMVNENIPTANSAAMSATPITAARGGYVGYAEGGDTAETPEQKKVREEQAALRNKTIGDKSYKAASDPASMVTDTTVEKIDDTDTTQKIDSTVGQVSTADVSTDGSGLMPKATASTVTAKTADSPDTVTTNLATTTDSQAAVETALEDVAAKNTQMTKDSTITAAAGDPEKMSALGVEDIKQIESPTQVVAPNARVIKPGEEIGGSAVDMAAVKEATDIKAVTADPSKKATVQGQLTDLMEDFEGGATPPWAAGAMRAATAAMAARGLGASSMAGQAIVQAAMESALPIAQQDSATFAKFESQNLSNKQQTAMFAAEQRAKFLEIDFTQEFQSRVAMAAKVSDIANLNFTADQQIALENSRLTQTANLANMSAVNGKVMADAAAMQTMDLANLSNEQQAVVENAKAFLQVDLANLANDQQVEVFKAQAVQQAILSDTAAKNAAEQFNASSKNQTDQFMATIKTQVSQFNTSQQNATEQFNAGEKNAIEKFNTEVKNQRDQFNATNSLVIAQANAVWRQNIATLDTSAQNDANKLDAATKNGLTEKAIDDIWQRERDVMAWAVATSESASERAVQILLADKSADKAREQLTFEEASAKSSWVSTMIFGSDGYDIAEIIKGK